jgi:surface-anchored protein
MSTFDGATLNDYYYAEGSHTHMSWGFSTPGIHRVRLKASAFAGPGATNPTGLSAVHTLTFAIGPFAQWQATHFTNTELDDPTVCGPDADPDHDGMKNLVEFGFGFDPRSGAAAPVSEGLGLPEMSLAEEAGTVYQVLEYPARRAGSQVSPMSYIPQFSHDMDWQSDAISTTTEDFPSELDALNGVWEKVIARRAITPGTPSTGFGRVGVDFGE